MDVTFDRLETTDDGLLLPAVQDNGLLLPAVQDDGLLLPAVQTDDAFVFTPIALAGSGGNSSPHGEDSLGLFQINVEPNQYDPDAFANDLCDPTGPAVATETLTLVHEGSRGDGLCEGSMHRRAFDACRVSEHRQR